MALTAGIRKWFPTENINIFSGLLGFDIASIVNTSSDLYRYITPDDGYNWIGIQNIGEKNLEIQAKKASDCPGDDLCKDGVFALDSTENANAGTNWLTMYPEDVIYGRFEVVGLKRPTAAGTDYIKLIRGINNG